MILHHLTFGFENFINCIFFLILKKQSIINYFLFFGVKVGVDQGAFIMVLEALSREFCTSAPWKLVFADDLVIIAESMEELLVKLRAWKASMDAEGLRVKMSKTKLMVIGHD